MRGISNGLDLRAVPSLATVVLGVEPFQECHRALQRRPHKPAKKSSYRSVNNSFLEKLTSGTSDFHRNGYKQEKQLPSRNKMDKGPDRAV